MQYLVVVQTKQDTEQKPPDDMPQLLAADQSQGRLLYGTGQLRQSWEIDGDRPGVVCLYEADSEKELQDLLDTYPLLRRGYSDVQIIRLKPDSAYTAGG